MQLALKRIFEKNLLHYLSSIMTLIRSLDQKKDWEIVETVLKYLINEGEVSSDELFRVIQTELPPETGDKIMTVAEQLIARGEQKGIQQGMSLREKEIAKNFLASGLEVDFVAKNTGLDIEFLKKLKEETQH